MRRALLAVLLAAALLPLRARAQGITAAPGGEMSSLVGMPFDVPIYVDMAARTEKLGSFAARIQWNTAVLQLDAAGPGTFGTISVNQDSLAWGVARIAGANAAGAGGRVTIAVMHFTPLLAQGDSIRLAVTELFAAGTFADLLPSLTTHGAYFCPARGMFGDIDKDGSVNSRDALIALSNAVGLDVSAFDIALGDVDANGVANARDALIILSYAVGLNVSAYRVTRLAGGSCAANLPLVMTVVPGTVDLVVGQTVAFEARAADSSGTLRTVADAIWKSSNAAVLAVAPDGTALAHDTGTARVTAIRTALDSAQAVVHIVAHRTRHIVDAAAASARNQLGSAALPFARINQGIAFAGDGDTVEVRNGRYAESVLLDRAAVLMGDTLADGTRPVVAGGTDTSYVGIGLTGGGMRQVRDLAVDGFVAGVDLYGPARALLHGLRGTAVRWGVVVEAPMANLRLVASRLTGIGAGTGEGDGVLTDAYVDTLVVDSSEISDFGLNGIMAGGTDSIAVLRSQVHDVGYYLIQTGPTPGECYECEDVRAAAAPARGPARANVVAPVAPAVVVDSSTVVRGYRVAYLEDTRSAMFAHSRLGGGEYGVEVYGSGVGWLRLLGDSIQGYGEYSYAWLNANWLDSLRVDSSYISSEYGNAYNVALIRVTNSQFANATDNPLGVSFGGTHGGGQVFLDNVTIGGDPHCDLCGDGFNFGPSAVVANRLTATNLWRGIRADYDSSLTITHSLFRHVEYPVYWEVSSADTPSRLTVTNTTFSGFGDGIVANTGAAVVDSNTFENSGGTAISVSGVAASRLTRNRIVNVADGIEASGDAAVHGMTDTIADNVMSGVYDAGIYAYGADTAAFRVLRNSVSCGSPQYATGIWVEYASAVLANNQVLGCSTGIYVYEQYTESPATRVDSILGNAVTVPASGSGIYVEGPIRSRIAADTVVADTAGASDYGGINVYGYTGTGSVAAVDSNTVSGGTTAGVYVANLDTALVRYNTLQGVVVPAYYLGAITTDGSLTYLARVYGNAVKGTHGNGIRITNADTAMVQVDSNLVSASDSVGIRMDGGADSITRNRIVTNGIGVEYASYAVDESRSIVSGNNIVGNRFGLMQELDARLMATNNWWGDANGPRCVSGCDLSVAGDSVSLGATFDPWAETEFGDTPSPAVRAFAAAGLRLRAAVAAPRGPATGLDAPLVPKPRAERAVVTSATAAPPGLTSARVPQGLGAAREQAWQRMLQRRAAALAADMQRDAAAGQVRAARVAADAARERQLEQRRAEREAALRASVAKRAAHASHPARGVRQ